MIELKRILRSIVKVFLTFCIIAAVINIHYDYTHAATISEISSGTLPFSFDNIYGMYRLKNGNIFVHGTKSIQSIDHGVWCVITPSGDYVANGDITGDISRGTNWRISNVCQRANGEIVVFYGWRYDDLNITFSFCVLSGNDYSMIYKPRYNNVGIDDGFIADSQLNADGTIVCTGAKGRVSILKADNTYKYLDKAATQYYSKVVAEDPGYNNIVVLGQRLAWRWHNGYRDMGNYSTTDFFISESGSDYPGWYGELVAGVEPSKSAIRRSDNSIVLCSYAGPSFTIMNTDLSFQPQQQYIKNSFKDSGNVWRHNWFHAGAVDTDNNTLVILASGDAEVISSNNTLSSAGYIGNLSGYGYISAAVGVGKNRFMVYESLNKKWHLLALNTPPLVTSISPSTDSTFSEADTAFTPTVSVSDPDNDTVLCKYYVDSETTPRDTVTNIANTITPQTVTFSNGINMSTLTEGNHTIRFEVSDGIASPMSTSVNIKIDKSIPTLGSIGVNSTSSSIAVSGSATDSIAGLDPYPYRYTVGNNVTSWLNDSSYTQSGLTPNTSYAVKFEARDAKGHIASNTQSIYTQAVVPSIVVNNATSYTLDINISDSNPATTQYQILAGSQYVTSTGTLSTTPSWITLTGKKITVNSLTPNTTYSFTAKARNAAGVETTTSAAASGTTLVAPPGAPPANLRSTGITQTGITLAWDAVTGATSYDIKIDGIDIFNVSSPYSHTGLQPNSTHTYSVRAKNAGGTSVWSTVLTKTTLPNPPNPPASVTATSSSTSITVNWSPVADATGYEIETSSGIVDVGTNTTYTHIGLTPDTQYTYRVRGKNTGGAGNWSPALTKSTSAFSPWTPLNVNAAATNTSVILTWDSVGGASGYDIKVDGVVVNNGSSTNYIHGGLIPGTKHSYQVRSINSGGKSDWSQEVVVTTLADVPPVPSNLLANKSYNQITLTWSPVQGAEYDIKVDGVERNNGTSTTFTHTGLTPNTQHTYQVRARKTGGTSDWSSVLTVSTLADVFGTPGGLKGEAGNNSITLQWDRVTGATGYELEVDGAILDNGTSTTCIHNGLTPNTTHVYRVRAKRGAETSGWSDPLVLTTYTLLTPQGVTAASTETSITLTWVKVDGAESYQIEKDGAAPISVASSVYGSVYAPAYTFEGLIPNTQHIFRIRAVNVNGTSAWSSPVTKSTLFNGYSIPATVSAISRNTSVTVVWTGVDNATAYDVEVDGVLIKDLTQKSYQQTGLTPGSTHTYRVRAKSGTKVSEWSNLIMATTLPYAPVTPANGVASTTTNTILVTWDKVDNVTGYEIEVDGSTIIDSGSGTSYLHTAVSPNTQHSYRVRSKNASGVSAWSAPVVAQTKNSLQDYELACDINEAFNLVITASDIVDPSSYTYTVTYNKDELDVVDLCAATARLDTGVGNPIGTDVEIVQFTPGTIVFKKLSGGLPGQVWTGEVNSIKFRSKVDGNVHIKYSIQ